MRPIGTKPRSRWEQSPRPLDEPVHSRISGLGLNTKTKTAQTAHSQFTAIGFARHRRVLLRRGLQPLALKRWLRD